MAQGSDYLVRVRLDALDDDGHVQEYIERAIDDVMTDVYVLDELRVLDPDADKPVLRGMFMQELSAALSRGMGIFFISAPDDDLAFWRDTLGAWRVGDFIVASGARPLPSYPKPTRVKPRPAGAPSTPAAGPTRRAERTLTVRTCFL